MVFIQTVHLFLIFNVLNIIKSQNTCLVKDKELGQCVFLTDCKIYYDLLKAPILTPTNRKLVLDSFCGTANGKDKVCCPQQKALLKPQIDSRLDIPIVSTMDFTSHKNARLLNNEICGNIIQDKIARGNKTEVFQFPWMAVIQHELNKEVQPACGGTAISARYILTAAHCITNLRRGVTVHSVILGEHDTRTRIDCVSNDPTNCADPVQVLNVERTIPHHKYNRRTFINDIGIIRLKSNIDFISESVRPICLPMEFGTQINFPRVKVTGWGLTESGIKSPVLMQANLNTVNNSYCSIVYKERALLQITPTHLCAGGGTSDSCEGDSGGPAIYQANFKGGPRYMQYGIVAAGVRTCGDNGGLPSLYTRVVPFLKWILDHMKE